MIGFPHWCKPNSQIKEERLVSKQPGKRCQQGRAKTVAESIRDFLTPAVFRQVRKAAGRRRKPRWDLYPLVHVLLVMTWCCGDSMPEKFEVAQGILRGLLSEA